MALNYISALLLMFLGWGMRTGLFCVKRLPEIQRWNYGDSCVIVAYGKRRSYLVACNEVTSNVFPLGFELRMETRK